MNIVFVDNLLFEDAQGVRRYILQPHLGLISLIAVLRGSGYQAQLYDPKLDVSQNVLRLDEHLYHRIADAIIARQPDVIGFTSLGCNFICTLKVARYIRAVEPDIPIMLGGPHATVLDQVIMETFPEFDVIMRNEGELKILPLIENIHERRFHKVPGITYVDSGRIRRTEGDPFIADLDALPIPAYDAYPIEDLGLDSLRVDAGRGCPFHCTFCSTASFFGRRYRLKTAQRLVDELDFLHNVYGIEDFALSHDLFTVNKRKVLEFCEAVEGKGYTWKCSARMDCVNDELLERMSAAGCRSIYYGIETGSRRMQVISKKGLDLNLFDPILAATQSRNMSATVSFITGYPEETHADQAATLDMIGSCFKLNDSPLNVQLHLLTPEPGTELLCRYENEISYDGHISDFNFPALEFDDSNVIESYPEVFINHHYFPSMLSRRRNVFVATAYEAIYSIGFAVLNYVIERYFKGQLSGLIDKLDRWGEAEGVSRVCDRHTLESFFLSRFGECHHVPGLIAYMLEAAELRELSSYDTVNEPNQHKMNDKAQYVLSPRVFIARNVPDCPRLVEFLTSNGSSRPPRGLLVRRFNFMVKLADGQNTRNYVLSDPSAAFLEHFKIPRTLRQGIVEFEQETDYPVPPQEFVDTLFGGGVLEPAVAEH